MGETVNYSDLPEGFSLKSVPASSYSDIPQGFSVKNKSVDSSDTDIVRSGYRGLANTLYKGINDIGGAVGSVASAVTPQSVKDLASKGVDYYENKSPTTSMPYHVVKDLIVPLEKKEVSDLSQYNQNLKPDLAALGENVKAAANLPVVTPVAEGGVKLGGSLLGKGREAVNAAADTLGKRVPIDKGNAFVIKTLSKVHTPEEIVEGMKRAKELGLTVGEAFNNPDILGEERKISGMNKPVGKTLRDKIKDRVDPKNNVSMPYRLKSIADPLAAKVDAASKEIGKITENAPKTPLRTASIESSLAGEKRPPKSSVTNTLNRIDDLVSWAKENGNTFADWHRVKQEIWDLKSEAKNPNAVEKLDSKTVAKYYSKINDMLSGKAPGLPDDLKQTAQKYKLANATFQKNLSGRTIQEVLEKMPTGGTPSSSLKFLYKQLADNHELQEELFSGMPASERPGMMKLLEAIKDSSRSGANDVVKSMKAGTPSFPTSWRSMLGHFKDKIFDALTRKDYDAIGKALASPDAEVIAKKMGFVKMAPPAKPILRLEYKPEKPDIFIGHNTDAIIGNEKIMKAATDVRNRLENLGLRTDIYRAQDLNVAREMEKKYGQSEFGNFIIANRNTPFIDKAWEVPQTEYSQATVDRMMRDSKLDKLSEQQQSQIHSEIENEWNNHRSSLADMILSARQAAAELAAAKGEPTVRNPFGKNPLSSTFEDLLKDNQ